MKLYNQIDFFSVLYAAVDIVPQGSGSGMYFEGLYLCDEPGYKEEGKQSTVWSCTDEILGPGHAIEPGLPKGGICGPPGSLQQPIIQYSGLPASVASLHLPPGTGIPVKSLVYHVHYPMGTIDNVSLPIALEVKFVKSAVPLRPVQVAYLNMFGVLGPRQIGYIDGYLSIEDNFEVTLLKMYMHHHGSGIGAKATLIRANGQERTIMQEGPKLEGIWNLEHENVTLKPGDRVRFRCVFDNRDRDTISIVQYVIESFESHLILIILLFQI